MPRPSRGWQTQRRNKAPSIPEGDLSSVASSSAHHLFGYEDATTVAPPSSCVPTEDAVPNIRRTADDSLSTTDESVDDSERPGAYAIYRSDRPQSMVSHSSRGWDPTVHSDGATAAPPLLPAVTREQSVHHSSIRITDFHQDEWSTDVCIQEKRQPFLRSKWGLLFAMICVLFGVGLAFVLTSREASAPAQLQRPEAETPKCDVLASKAVSGAKSADIMLDPFLQCDCFQKIEMNVAVREVYNGLKLYEQIDELLDSNMNASSCDHMNVALVWISDELVAAQKREKLEIDSVVRRLVLAYLYGAWGGKDWVPITNWTNHDSECAWKGVTCDEGRITELFLVNTITKGSIETRIGALRDLQRLSLVEGGLTGTIPMEVWRLPQLEELSLETNKLEGTIPADLASSSPSLKSLVLSGNDELAGPLPSLNGLSDLTELDLSGTKLSGTLPPDAVADLRSLELLNLSDVIGISGPLPSTLGLLTSLKVLDISGTALSGTLPESIGNMFSLESFSAIYSNLYGSIPTSIGNLEYLEALKLKSSGLIGAIPSELGLCTQLTFLGLGNNMFTGTVPVEFEGLTNLDFFILSGTVNIKGPMPSGICDKSEEPRITFFKEQLDKDFKDCSCCGGDYGET